jgi:hypothetical protein
VCGELYLVLTVGGDYLIYPQRVIIPITHHVIIIFLCQFFFGWKMIPTKENGKNDLLDRCRLEREKRAHTKAMHGAAIAIQRNFRRWSVQDKQTAFLDILQHCNTMIMLDYVPRYDTLRLLRTVVKLGTRRRLHGCYHVAPIFAKSANNKNHDANVLSICIDGSFDDKRCFQVVLASFFRICFQALASDWKAQNDMIGVSDICSCINAITRFCGDNVLVMSADETLSCEAVLVGAIRLLTYLPFWALGEVTAQSPYCGAFKRVIQAKQWNAVTEVMCRTCEQLLMYQAPTSSEILSKNGILGHDEVKCYTVVSSEVFAHITMTQI